MTVLWSDCVSQNLYVEIVTPKGDDISRCDLWEVIVMRVEPTQMGPCPYK